MHGWRVTPKWSQYLALSLLVVGLTACGPTRVARLTAENLEKSVEEYRTEVEAVLAAEERFYREMSESLQKARAGLSIDSTIALRNQQVVRFIDWLVEDPSRRATQTAVTDFLLKAAQEERAVQEKLRTDMEAAKINLVSQIEKFERQNTQIGVVRGYLHDLATERSDLEGANWLLDFQNDVRRQLEKQAGTKGSQ